MAQSLRPDEFENAVNAILAEYKDKINVDVERITREVAKDTVADVKKNAPVRTGSYKKSIKAKAIEKNVNSSHTTVYANAPHYRLTHLLEFGHATRNGGRTKAQPHWSQAEQAAIREYEQKLREAIE